MSAAGPKSALGHWRAAEGILERVATWATTRPKAAFSVIALITLVLGAGLPRIEVNNTNELWFEDDDETVARHKAMKELFGNDEFLFFLIPADDVFEPKTRLLVQQLADALSGVKYLGRPAFRGTVHFLNVSFVQAEDDRIDIVPIGESLPLGEAGTQELRRRLYSVPLYEGLLVNRRGTATGLVANLRDVPLDDQFRLAVTDAVREIMARGRFADAGIIVAGGAILDADMDRATAEESVFFGAFAVLANLFVMVFLFRRPAGVLIPMAVVLTTLVWTFGTMGHAGVGINIAHVILPAMLVAVGIADAVHILSDYQATRLRGLARDPAIVSTLRRVGLGCLLTTLTTGAGMISLMLAPVPPIQTLGLFAAIGVLYAYLITMLFVPALLTVLGLEGFSATRDWSGDLLDRVGRAATHHARKILIGASMLAAACLGYASTIVIDTSFVQAFKREFPTRRAFDAIDATLGSTTSMQIVFDTGRPGGAREPEFLQRMGRLQEWFNDHPLVVKTLSVADLVKNTHQVLTDGAIGNYAIPTSRTVVAQELLLHENSDPDGLYELVSDDYQLARLEIRARSVGTLHANRLLQDATAQAEKLLGAHSDFHFTGLSHLFVRMATNLSRGQIRSYLFAFVLISIMMILVLRSVRLGLWSMVPNVLPVVVTLGVMGALGVRLDFITLLVACVAIGVAVDDTIHFLVRFQREFADCGNYAEAVHRSITSVGRAMLFTTLILCSGFLMFVPSVMQSVTNFGVLVALTATTALVADVVLMPAILVVFKPLGPEVVPPSRAGVVASS